MAKIHILHDGDNIGSIAHVIEIAHHTDFSSFAPIAFKAGKGWNQVEILPAQGSLEPTREETDNGMRYTYQGRFRIHHPTAELEATLAAYIGQRSVLRIRDMNGRYWVIGSPVCPVTIVMAGDTGETYTGAPHYQYGFRVEQPHPAL
ncbi:MAG TPA: hypothetical protein VNQ80_15375 [Parapedobacter sp.]|uniref:hypothetical protein n=1 Tax=Parapedobacter sp. TaxID=1958893 RepID=UPI002B63827F|nr:hypothetical protein [Parapedobacter sp.]HWK58723.1 hypothetical protein [Parapedobacter sp.]